MFAFLFVLIISTTLFAQQKTVTGTVTDKTDGSGIPGVTIREAGTTNGTITDLDGKYTITVKSAEAKLIFSFVGYATTDKIVGLQKTINVALASSAENLDELVVVGYGVQKKADKTGAVALVKAADLVQGNLSDPIQGMQGKTAGVLISKKGGDPNGGFSVNIRGTASFGSNTQPLYVVDGVSGVDITTISPDEIESFNILKDAASTAIYGSRGSNGVIFVTTKNGQSKKGQVTFSANTSMDWIAKKLDMLSASDIRKYVSDNNLNFNDGGADVNWQDQIYRTGTSQNYNLGFSGGDDMNQYNASIMYADWQGIMKGTSKNRIIGKVYVQHKGLDDKLFLSAMINGSFEHNDYENYGGFNKDDIIYQAISHNPTDPVYTPTGDYYRINREFNYENPLAVINMIDNFRDSRSFLSNLKMNYDILNGLVFSNSFSYIRNDDESSYFRPKNVYTSADAGYGSKRYNNNQQKEFESTLTYTTSINKTHNITALAGYTWLESKKNGFNAGADNPQSDLLKYNKLSSFIGITSNSIDSYAEISHLIGYFSRLQYNYLSKYYLTLSVRRDGSSKFGANNKWGVFPTASTGYNLHEENFIKNIDWISQFKIRASFGSAGNQNFDNYLSQLIFEPNGVTINPETGEKVISFSPKHNANKDLKWETTKEANLGIDFGFLKNRINGSLEVYSKITDDLVAPVQVNSPPNLVRTTYMNTGSISNKGFELTVIGSIIDHNKFSWDATITGSHNKSIIESFGGFNTSEEQIDGYISGRGLIGEQTYVTANRTGQERGAFSLPVYVKLSTDGLFVYQSKTGGITSVVLI